jgi:hypothetical protein
MTHLLLAHLSKNNNCPVLTKKLFDDHSEGVEIIVASRFEETDVYRIGSYAETKMRSGTKQLSLVFE